MLIENLEQLNIPSFLTQYHQPEGKPPKNKRPHTSHLILQSHNIAEIFAGICFAIGIYSIPFPKHLFYCLLETAVNIIMVLI